MVGDCRAGINYHPPMRINRDVNAEAFARRLQDAANRRGLTSGRSRSGVDIVALSDATGVSYEMARRYAEGLATPRPDAIKAIASWLHVSPAWLAYGETSESPHDLDTGLLEACIRAVQDAQRRAGVELSTERQAVLVSGLYEQARDGQAPSPSSVAAAIKAMST